MDRRGFLATASLAGLAQAAPALAGAHAGPALLTVGGAIARGNRGAVDPALDQLMVRHGVHFSSAFAFDSPALLSLPAITIRPTLEYDETPHRLRGPLLTKVLEAAGVDTGAAARVGIRAIDGYRIEITSADIAAYRMILATHLDDRPLPLGGLGPQWAVFDPAVVPALRDKPLKERFALCPWGVYYIDVATG